MLKEDSTVKVSRLNAWKQKLIKLQMEKKSLQGNNDYAEETKII